MPANLVRSPRSTLQSITGKEGGPSAGEVAPDRPSIIHNRCDGNINARELQNE